jgi:hypothetical protein
MPNQTPAQAIKAELKIAFPNIKFSVRYQTFAGGDAVNVSYLNGVPEAEVEKITNKYQMGHFNGMEDIYEYSNNIEGLNQAKYISVGRNIDDSIKLEMKQKIAKSYGIEDMENEQEWMKKTNRWSDQVVYQELKNISL